MIQRLLYAAAIWAAAATAAFAQASSGTFGESGRAEEPMELDQSETTIETTEEAPPADGGFWMFPEPAPMTGRIATDRPAFSDTASLVPRGRIQIEGGYQFTYDREGKKRTYDHLFPETALRTGLTDWLEFRMKWNGYSLTETTDQFTTRAGRRISRESHDDSGTDLNLGFKLPLIRDKDSLPNISVIPSLTVPTGGAGKTAGNVVPEVKFPWNYGITDDWAVYGSYFARVNDGPGGQFFQNGVTLATAYDVHDRVKLYLEYLGLYPAVRDEPIIWLTNNLSLDMRATVGLNEQAPDFQTSVGFGIRF
jgi:hypothetical protein